MSSEKFTTNLPQDYSENITESILSVDEKTDKMREENNFIIEQLNKLCNNEHRN